MENAATYAIDQLGGLCQYPTMILLALSAFTLLYISITSSRKPSKLFPPGPVFRLPILGHLASLDPKEPFKTMNHWAAKYGPVLRLQFGSFPVVVLNDYDSIRQAFIKQGDEFDDRPEILHNPVWCRSKGLVFSKSSVIQRTRRRFCMSALRDLGMGKVRLKEQISEEIQRLCTFITKYEAKAFSPARLLDMIAWNVMCFIVYGNGFEYDDPKILRILTELEDLLKNASFTKMINYVPIMRYVPFSGFQNKEKGVPELQGLIAQMIQKSRIDRASRDTRTFIDLYFDYQVKIQQESPDMSEYFDYKDLFICISELFGAGSDTSFTLQWGLLYMVLHPDIQKKIQAELDSVVGRNRMPSLKDRARLPYTEAILLEIQRMGSIGPLGNPRAATTDTKLHGYDIDKGTMVLANLWAVHRDEKIWVKAETFKPERFLDANGSKVVRREEQIPFSIGKRKCLGEQLALMELFLIFSHLLHTFSIRLPKGACPNLEPVIGINRVPRDYQIIAELR